jgi:hypothetical protein
MRNYWLKILLGALAIFAVGMIGVPMARRGIAGVERVVASDQPLTIPLSLIPFELEGERLGKLDHVTLMRKSPNEVTAVELEIQLADSMVAGASGVPSGREYGDQGRQRHRHSRRTEVPSVFYCAGAGDTARADLLEYGHAVLQPGDVEIPLLLTRDMVKELQHIDFGKGGPGAAAEAQADSIAAASEEQGDSISAAVQRALKLQGQDRQRALDSIKASARRLGDSLRAVGLRQADSARREALNAESAGSEAHRVADSTTPR